MGRKKRIDYPGAMHHVFARGNEKKNIFKTNTDRFHFIKALKEAKEKSGFILHAFVLMPNHYHLLIELPEGGIGKVMKLINERYSMYFNWKHKRVGHLFQGRYKNELVEKDWYMAVVIAYIHLNPVKAGLTERLVDYKWSSHIEYAGGKGIGIADTQWLMNYLRSDNNKFSPKYIKFMSEIKGVKSINLDNSVGRGIVFGSGEFVRTVKKNIRKKGIRIPLRLIVGKNVSYEDVEAAVCGKLKVNRLNIKDKKGKYNYARRMVVFLLRRNTNMKFEEIAKKIGIHPVTAKNLHSKIKKEVWENETVKSLAAELETLLLGSDPKSSVYDLQARR